MAAGSGLAHRSPSGRWAYDVGFELLRHRFRVRTDSTAAGEAAGRVLGGFRRPTSGDVTGYTVTEASDGAVTVLLDGVDVLAVASPADALERLRWHAVGQAVGRCEHLLLVHAAVVSLHGVGIVLPAASGSGKTTLAAGLVRTGFSYLSDELAAIDVRTSRVSPVPLALSVKPGSFDVLAGLLPDLPVDVGRFLDGRIPVRAEDIRVDAHGAAVPARFVIAPRYVPGAETSLEPMSGAEGLGELVRNAFNLDRFGRDGFDLLSRVVRGASCYRLTVGDLDHAVRILRETVSGHDTVGGDDR